VDSRLRCRGPSGQCVHAKCRITHLRRKDVDLEALHIRKSKNEGSKRILPLNSAALGTVKMMIERADLGASTLTTTSAARRRQAGERGEDVG